MLHNAVRTFSDDLSVISETIKQRTVQQIKTALQKKVLEISSNLCFHGFCVLLYHYQGRGFFCNAGVQDCQKILTIVYNCSREEN